MNWSKKEIETQEVYEQGACAVRLGRSQTDKGPRGECLVVLCVRAVVWTAPRWLRNGLLGLVDVVADHAAEDTADRGADDAALDLVAARRRADHRAGSGADGSVTLVVLHRHFTRLAGDRAAARSGARTRRAAAMRRGAGVGSGAGGAVRRRAGTRGDVARRGACSRRGIRAFRRGDAVERRVAALLGGERQIVVQRRVGRAIAVLAACSKCRRSDERESENFSGHGNLRWSVRPSATA